MTVFCEECKHLPNCDLAKHEEVDTCTKGEKLNDDIIRDCGEENE